MSKETYAGSKIALILNGKLLTYRRDNKPTIPFPNFWDFPGGAREGNETPQQCALRELEEEFSIVLNESRIEWGRRYENQREDGLAAYFFVALVLQEEIDAIQFSDEGQYWELASIEDFLSNEEAVPQLKNRLREYLDDRAEQDRRSK
ncbi:MAG: NUDIX hydrolase [Pseudomonadota bacterium]